MNVLYQSAKEFINLFYSLVKASQVYHPNNDVVVMTAKKFIQHYREIFKNTQIIEIVRYRDYLFFNKLRLRFDVDGYAGLQFFEEKLKRMRIKNVKFTEGLTEKEAIRFASIFRGDKNSFLRDYTLENIKSISVDFLTDQEELPEFFADSENVKRTYFKALKVTKNLIQNLWSKQPVDAKGFRRVVYTLVDNLSQDEYSLVGLTAIKNFDEYTFNHSLNVGILSLAMGQRTSLTKKGLVKLGTAGLLHDIGKVEIPKELLYKNGKLTTEEWRIMKMHSAYGVRQIIKARGLDEIALSAIIGTYQHHWNFDGSGYPGEEKSGRETALIARIIRICDAYDAMTTSRPYQVVPYLPPIAIRAMWNHRGTFFDPTILKIFVQILGIYPVGTCLELTTDEIGIVIRQNLGYITAPIIKIILNDKKQQIDGRIIDLSINADINIVKPVYPQKYNINPTTYFV